MRIVVIGSADCVLGFNLAGISGHVVHDAAELSAALDSTLRDRSVSMLLVSADVAGMARARIDQLKAVSISPLVIEVPGEKTGTSFPSLLELVQRSVGISFGGK